jgi:hypothetical protein
MDADVGIHLSNKVQVKDWTIFGQVDIFYTRLSAKSAFIGEIPIPTVIKVFLKYLRVHFYEAYISNNLKIYIKLKKGSYCTLR